MRALLVFCQLDHTLRPYNIALCCRQRPQWRVRRRTVTSRTTRTRRTAPCTTCVRESASTTCRAPPTSSSTPTRTCATGPRTWRAALSTPPRRPPAGGDSVRLNAPRGRESAERAQAWRHAARRDASAQDCISTVAQELEHFVNSYFCKIFTRNPSTRFLCE